MNRPGETVGEKINYIENKICEIKSVYIKMGAVNEAAY